MATIANECPIVLFVDDEVMLGPLVGKYIEASFPGRVKVVPRVRGEDAIAFLDSHDGARVRLVIVDLHLAPSMTGREFIRRVLARWPGLRGRIVVSTGETLERKDPLFELQGCERLDKPIGLDDLRGFVAGAIGDLKTDETAGG